LAASQSGSYSKVINITSLLGSNAYATQALERYNEGHAYFASKAALNMFTQCMAHDLKKDNIAVGAVHPGYVSTDMNDHRGTVQPEDSVNAMLKVFDDITLETSGSYRSYTGDAIPW
jgi:NAD(P)-dependent dehydrogenase (short-subunit alcohol dehydrogenase family)